MIGRDILSDVAVVKAVAPIDVTDNTAFVGAIIDNRDYLGGFYAITSGVLADAAATWTVLVEEGDASDLSDATAVADVDLLPSGTGQEATASFTQAEDGTVKTIGYVGIKAYHRLTLTPANNASSGPFSVHWVGLKRVRGNATGS